MKNDLAYYLTKFFEEFTTNVKGLSKNTIASYKDTFLLFITYLTDVKKICINSLSIKFITKSIVEEFLEYLEFERKNSISTRNQRLSAIQSFFDYLRYKDISYVNQTNEICTIPFKKAPAKNISYFTKDEIKILLNTPNQKIKCEYKEFVMLSFMYETGCRAEEVVALSLKQIRFNNPTTITVTGKGNKTRVIPITNAFSKTLEEYIKVFDVKKQDAKLFLSSHLKPYTTKGLEYILKKHVAKAKELKPDFFKGNYHNHCMRHTRAMHLLEAGVDLIYIRDFLGHSSITTTEIYAKTNPVIKEKEILAHSELVNVKSKYSEEEKEKLITMLRRK